MDTKVLVTLNTPQDAQLVRATGCEILAEYPNSMLVRCDETQLAALRDANIEITIVTEPEVNLLGMSFSMDTAQRADELAPLAPDADRMAYYLVQLAGPPPTEWLNRIQALGGVIQGNLGSNTLLVGILPPRVPELEAETWVTAVTIYRPAMKVSPNLSLGASRTPSSADLAELGVGEELAETPEQVEVTVFEGENTALVAAQIRNSDGFVLTESDRKVIAVVLPSVIANLAREQSVQAIVPHQFPTLHNNVAATIMEVPVNRLLAGLSIDGAGEIVGVADSGLDTGDAATIHADFAGRIVGIVSLPVRPELDALITDPPGTDDGPADRNSGHGTHVAGSVLGSGAAATAIGDPTVPSGMAPAAQLFFQAIEQEVHWKTAAQLIAEGVPPNVIPPDWPPDPIGLHGLPDNLNPLFNQAYANGVRIHTNSWGSSASQLQGVYNDSAREVDEFLWNHRDMIILFSAGNTGADADGSGIIDPDSLGPPATAKNCISVGASENNRPPGVAPAISVDRNWNQWLGADGTPRWPNLGPAGHISDNANGMAAFSSRGPTDDGRLKPDVTAPGTNILSVRTSAFVATAADPEPLWGDLDAGHPLRGLYCWSGGTSMSTPLVAGVVALIRQHLTQHRGHLEAGVKPSGALIKAFLINGAVPMTGQYANEISAGRNNVCGFGRVNASTSLTPGKLARTVFDDEPDHAVETGQIRTFAVSVLNVDEPIKITLVWTDAPAPVNVGGLQNQLYLQLVLPDGTIIDGDTTPFPTATNNVQQIEVAQPAQGVHRIRVRGVAVIQQSPGAAAGANVRQDFALAVSNAIGAGL
jgi:serine protease AprX